MNKKDKVVAKKHRKSIQRAKAQKKAAIEMSKNKSTEKAAS